jgi:hypothetical protein
MERCWAKSLGDCSNRISGEHIFTAGLFEEDRVFIQGMDWCKDEPKQIGKKSLVKNVLCTTHNSKLSVDDDEAISAFKLFRESVRLSDLRQYKKPDYWTVPHWTVNGGLFERWFLKTLINIACEQDRPIGRYSEIAGQPSPDLVKIVFGLEKFRHKAGLYVPAAAGQSVEPQDRVEYVPMANGPLKERGFLPGAMFVFRGYNFILYLGEEGLDPNAELQLPRPLINASIRVLPIFHLRAMISQVNGRKSHVIQFRW